MFPDTHPRVRRKVDEPEASFAVVVTRAVADAKGVDPTVLRPFDTVVPSDARSTLYQDSETEFAVQFEYADHPVAVHEEGEVRVYPADASLGE